MATHGTSGSRRMATSAHVASTWKARPSAPTASSGLRKRLGTVGSAHARGGGQSRGAGGVGLRGLTASLGHVRRLALGKGRERQALERVDGAPVLDADERARALQRVHVVVQVGVQARNRLMGHAAGLAWHGGVLGVAHGHVVVLGRLGAPLVHLRLRHQDLAVVPAKKCGEPWSGRASRERAVEQWSSRSATKGVPFVRRHRRGADADAARGADVEAGTCVWVDMWVVLVVCRVVSMKWVYRSTPTTAWSRRSGARCWCPPYTPETGCRRGAG